MDVARRAALGRHGHRRVRDALPDAELRFAEVGPELPLRVPRRPCVVRRELAKQERHVRSAEVPPPLSDERGKQRVVLPGLGRIALALIPDHAADAVGKHLRDDPLIPAGGLEVRVPPVVRPVHDYLLLVSRVGVVGLQGRLAHPPLGPCRSNRGVDDRDRHTGESRGEVPHEVARDRRCAEGPLVVHSIPLVGAMRQHGPEDAHILEGIEGLPVGLPIGHQRQGVPHVRLPSRDPDLPHLDTRHGDRLAVRADRHGARRGAYVERAEDGLPAPIGSRRPVCLLARELHGHLHPCASRAPDRRGHA